MFSGKIPLYILSLEKTKNDFKNYHLHGAFIAQELTKSGQGDLE